MTAIDSSAFAGGDGWRRIGEGYGDAYRHAQGDDLPKPLTDECGIYRYKLAEGKAIERTQEEVDADRAAKPSPEPTAGENVSLKAQSQALSERSDFLEDCVVEMRGNKRQHRAHEGAGQ